MLEKIYPYWKASCFKSNKVAPAELIQIKPNQPEENVESTLNKVQEKPEPILESVSTKAKMPFRANVQSYLKLFLLFTGNMKKNFKN